MILNTLRICGHACERMKSRGINSKTLVQIFQADNSVPVGGDRLKYSMYQMLDNTQVSYHAILSEKDNVVVTVWNKTLPARTKNTVRNKPAKRDSHHQTKLYQHRKSAICEKEFKSYCREELLNCNIRCCA